ncbi:hypothetical protein CYMTET_30692 [Cymbomonas tetramitiformis]|uniref:Uncharacterized protein n=1 Tax=Cymbomonas tetramitiformis TaxID=36881 RepID=A0AAE0FIB4_9CHLO|nr:hypothetical protein CYMTET_30692 [Cymbomonas tetramitiformis]
MDKDQDVGHDHDEASMVEPSRANATRPFSAAPARTPSSTAAAQRPGSALALVPTAGSARPASALGVVRPGSTLSPVPRPGSAQRIQDDKSLATYRELAVGAEELRPPSAWNRSNKVKDSAQFGGVQPEVLSAKLREAAEERSQNMYAELDRQVEAVTSGLDPIQLAKKQFPYHRKGSAGRARGLEVPQDSAPPGPPRPPSPGANEVHWRRYQESALRHQRVRLRHPFRLTGYD